MVENAVIQWLLEGDVSIKYQVYRDLLNEDRSDLQHQIAEEGWGAKFLSLKNSNGHWGAGFYSPKWISSHYTLLDLKNLCITPHFSEIKRTISKILQENVASDGGVNPTKSVWKSDVCVNGMFLNYACYFETSENQLKTIVDFILSQYMPDGGFNCHSNRTGAVHSSLHTTLSVLEGIWEYSRNGYTYRIDDLKHAESTAREFILEHKLYQSHRTGKTIDPKMLMLSFPSRWRYDILRALDYFQAAGVSYDIRMQDALDVIRQKQRLDKTWPVQARHNGITHFEMEITGHPSRWNTLRSLRVFQYYNIKKKFNY